MQPYLFPYLGYFQLMATSDVFVSHDDVQYIKGGWINRNRILRNGVAEWITLPVVHAPHDRPINERQYSALPRSRAKLLRQLNAEYRKAAHFAPTMELVESALSIDEPNVARLNGHVLKEIAAAIGIRTPILESSQLDFDHALKGADRVAAICRSVGATVYLNPVGGTNLYSSTFFAARQLELRFLNPQAIPYPQGREGFVPWLSIIDALMHVGAAGLPELLRGFATRQG
jgi:hypothetical protein